MTGEEPREAGNSARSPIGELSPQEFPVVVGLWEDAGLTRPWNDPEADLRRALRGPASTVLAARRDSEVIGTVMVGHDGHRGWVYYLAVRRTEQGQGIGRGLLAAAEEWLRVRGTVKVQLMVRAGNDVGGFYEQLGYVDAGVRTYGKWLSEP